MCHQIICNNCKIICNYWHKLYVPVVTLSTQDNTNLLQQSKSSFKTTINWKKYQSKVSI